MNGKELLQNLIDELERARTAIADGLDENLDEEFAYELLNDISLDLERYYDYEDSLHIVLEDIEIE